jgi:Spy/CpxP family protein refolding chaperone
MTMKKVLAIGTAAAIAVSASSYAVAAPIGSGQLSLKSAVAGDVIDVSSRGRRNTALAVGAGALLLGGALAAGAYAQPSPYYYASPAPPPPQRCWVQTGPYRGQGYWSYC